MQKNEKKMEGLFGSCSNSGTVRNASVPELFLGLAAEMEKTAYHLRMTAAGRNSFPTERPGLYLPAELLEDAGFPHITGLDDLACTIEEGRILLELPDEEDEAEAWDTLREELPEGVCTLLEDLGADPTAVWDILEEEGWFEC